MKPFLSKLKQFLTPFFNTRAAGVYLILFAAAIGIATFIENDFGTSSAQKVIFKSWWFEFLLFMFGGTILVNIVKFRMIQQKKWTLVIFHSAILVILLGAGITRYFGFEGMMHIREDSMSNRFLSSNAFLKFEVEKGSENYQFDEPVLFATLGDNEWEESYLLGKDLVEIEVKQFIPNPKQVLYESIDGTPMLKIVVAGANGREEYFIEKGQTQRIRNVIYNFNDQPYPEAINIRYKNDSLLFTSPRVLSQTVMATQEKDTIYPSNIYQSLRLRALYSDGVNNFVFSEFSESAKVKIESETPKVKNESLTGLVMNVSVNGNKREAIVYGRRGMAGRPEVLNFDELKLSVAYGAKEIELPFSIKLYDFILEKYPGTNSAASYASEVQLIDDRKNVREDYRIYMNNILNYEGYRFFQSSFDRDEKGTYLSVNHDYWGSLISYIGYALLTIGMIFTFFSKKTRFYQLTQKIQKLRSTRPILTVGFLLMSTVAFAQTETENGQIVHAVDKQHAEEFSRIIVQDFNGRMKPIHTLSREILRKISRKESWFGLTADQILMSLFVNTHEWHSVPLIKLGKHEEIFNLLEVSGKHAAYQDFFSEEGEYKLRAAVRSAYGKDPIDRGVYEKELMKIDERVNILSMAFSGKLLAIIPNPNDPNNTWISNNSHRHSHDHSHSTDEHYQGVAEKFFGAYLVELKEAIKTDDYHHAEHLLDELKEFQEKNGGDIMPGPAKVSAEIWLNESSVFFRLTFLYVLLGLAFLTCLFATVFKPELDLRKVYLILFSLVGIGFIFHTLGLGIRWYVSGRAPWSNGYESMIYIAWTTTLAGVLFTRKSFGGLAATMILAATILFVATLSFLDPEITPLVPVLKSYWLTIHVSLEAGSYGFLMLGAIIGLINLILMIFLRESNQKNVKRIIQEMSYLSELTLTSGLFMISVGTYLGGVWANESWGRYWGWDAKETWALVTILIYAFILHMRIIPKLFGLFAYNMATIFGLASVVMTYYGVNYYLSGLHSYAAGDPVPIPSWVYIAVAIIVMISGMAYWKKRQYPTIS